MLKQRTNYNNNLSNLLSWEDQKQMTYGGISASLTCSGGFNTIFAKTL